MNRPPAAKTSHLFSSNLYRIAASEAGRWTARLPTPAGTVALSLGHYLSSQTVVRSWFSIWLGLIFQPLT